MHTFLKSQIHVCTQSHTHKHGIRGLGVGSRHLEVSLHQSAIYESWAAGSLTHVFFTVIICLRAPVLVIWGLVKIKEAS